MDSGYKLIFRNAEYSIYSMLKTNNPRTFCMVVTKDGAQFPMPLSEAKRLMGVEK